MSTEPLVNGQIVDSVTGLSTLVTGQAASHAFAMLDAAMVEAVAMAMYNAVNRQQGAGQIGSAAVTAACAKMLSVPFQVPPPPPPPTGPQAIEPLKAPSSPSDPTAALAKAIADAEAALSELQARKAALQTVLGTVTADVTQFVQSPLVTPYTVTTSSRQTPAGSPSGTNSPPGSSPPGSSPPGSSPPGSSPPGGSPPDGSHRGGSPHSEG